jgi:hypothetical protein
MLGFIGRTAGRHVLSATTKATASSVKFGQLDAVTPRAVSLRRLAPIARGFTASAHVRFPAAAKGATKTTPKKTATKKTATKKTATKKKAPKKKAKKAAKPLSPEEKEKAEIRELRKMSLPKGPGLKPESAWSVYVSQNVTSGNRLVDQIRGISTSFKSLSDFERTVSNTATQQALNILESAA